MQSIGTMNGGSLQERSVEACKHILIHHMPLKLDVLVSRSYIPPEGSPGVTSQRFPYICYLCPDMLLLSFRVYVLHILTGRQNEPQYSNSPYPTCTMTPDVDGRIGRLLRALLNSVGLTSVKLIGYEVRLFISPQCSKLGCT